jgi:hypothetical protein
MNKLIRTIKGKVPVIISAPHSQPHKRPSLDQIIKQEEPYTDDIAVKLAKDTDCWAIYTTDLAELDPSYYSINEGNEYKKLIQTLNKEAHFKYFIDLHGLNPVRNYDFGIYYKNRFLNSEKLSKEISVVLKKQEFKEANIQILKLPENKQESLAEFCAEELKIPSIQIEIAEYIRNDSELREEFVKILGNWIKKQ